MPATLALSSDLLAAAQDGASSRPPCWSLLQRAIISVVSGQRRSLQTAEQQRSSSERPSTAQGMGTSNLKPERTQTAREHACASAVSLEASPMPDIIHPALSTYRHSLVTSTNLAGLGRDAAHCCALTLLRLSPPVLPLVLVCTLEQGVPQARVSTGPGSIPATLKGAGVSFGKAALLIKQRNITAG